MGWVKTDVSVKREVAYLLTLYLYIHYIYLTSRIYHSPVAMFPVQSFMDTGLLRQIFVKIHVS